ncbi:MAG: hypothetical protein AB7E21_10860 [Pseudodonghicola sp.]|uniref:hypothetical protein n=1 Tax=Pseudodonghicola sp. TaxID=1969463 RepID=UPI003A984B05
MREERLLEQIWGDAIEYRAPADMSPLAKLLSALLTVPTVALVSHAGVARAHALMESAELLPGASLGDVLVEELGIDIPHDAVVLIEPVASAEAEEVSGNALGQDLGHILIELASTGHSPLIRPEAFAVAGAETGRAASRPIARDFTRIVTDIDRRPYQEELRAQ